MSSPIRVLYVDDEPDLLDLAQMFLEDQGEFTIDTITSARAALERLNTERYDAIVSDYQMPELDGIQFLVEVRTRFGQIPFIIFTGKGREEIAIKAFENGADFYIQKGGEPKSQFAELSNKIRKAVGHRRAEIEVTALSRLYNVLSATNKAIVRIHDKKELLDEVCRIVVDIGGFRMAWAGHINPEKHFINPVAAYGYVDGYLDDIAISTDDIFQGRGPTGTAYREKTFHVCNDVANDPDMAPWRENALKRGYHSVAAFPFALTTKYAGVITFYASEPGFFTDQIIRLLDEQSSDLTFAFVTLDHDEERASAGKNLKKSELQYRRLFETAQDAILILDGDTGEVIDANKFILDMLGYPLEDFIGKHLWELGFIKDKSLAQDAFKELKKKGYIRYEDLPLETKDGQSMDVEFISNVYLVGDKKIIQCNIRNITARKLAEKALADSGRRTLFSLEAAEFGAWELDLVTHTAWRSIRHDQIFGYEELLPEWTYEMFLNHVLPEDRSMVDTKFGHAMKNLSVWDFECRIRRKDGVIRWIWAKGRPEYNDLNEPQKMFGLVQDITDKKRVEEELKESSERLQLIFDAVNDGVHIHKIELDGKPGKFIAVNGAACRMLGYSREEMLEHGPFDFVTGYHSRPVDDIIVELFSTGQAVFETEHRRTDGTTVLVEINAKIVQLQKERVIVSVVRDITGRKREEAAFRQLSADYKTIIDHVPAMIWYKDTKNNFIRVNPAGAQAFGKNIEEIEGKSTYDLFPDFAEKYYQDDLEVINSGKPKFGIIEPMTTASGEQLWVQTNKIPLRDEKGVITGILAFAVDITERILEERREIFTAEILGILNDPSNLADSINLILAAIKRETGFDAVGIRLKNGEDFPYFVQDGFSHDFLLTENTLIARDAVGGPCRDENGKISLECTCGLVLSGRADPENPLFTEAGSAWTNNSLPFLDVPPEQDPRFHPRNMCIHKGYLSVALIPIRANREIVGLLQLNDRRKDRFTPDMIHFFEGIVLSIGIALMRKREKVALEEANKKLNLLSSITRHDINNQLMSVNGFLELLHKKVPDPALDDYFTRITKASARISTMIQFTKEYEQIGVNAPVWQDIRTLVENAVKEAPLGKVKVKNDLPDDAEVFADPLIAKVFYNLMDNAMRYGGKITTLRFSVEDAGDDHVLICEDDGEGIPTDEKEKIFEKGFGKNTGLGLFLSREILAITGITIKETGEPGKGARFEMTVPKGMWRNDIGRLEEGPR